jgi:hypothetical protein
MSSMTPKQLLEKYSNGLPGCSWEQDQYDYLMKNSRYSMFRYGSSEIKYSGVGKLSRPYLSYLKFEGKRAFKEKQVTGDCVSQSTRNACDITRAVEIDIHNEPEAWISIGATELIYGSRGHGGQGMSCARAARFVSQDGGIVVRQKYNSVDLSQYQGMLGAKWGSRGIPSNVMELTTNKIQTVSLVKTVEEARDALANGYALSVCSGYGFSSVRDNKGFARPLGSWSHAMAWIACDDTGSNGPAFLVQNSWGKWNDGGHPEWGPIPDGSFLITADVAEKMLKGNGAYAFSNFDGFPAQDLPDYGFEQYLGV